MRELWDLYDPSRKKTGAAVERGQTIPDGSYHLVVSVWIMNSQGEFLLSQLMAQFNVFMLFKLQNYFTCSTPTSFSFSS